MAALSLLRELMVDQALPEVDAGYGEIGSRVDSELYRYLVREMRIKHLF